MKKKITAAITCAATLASVPPSVPSKANAADEYLIRDKWGYCTTANYAESEHFVIFYGNNDTTGQVNDEFLRRNLEDYEKLWKCYGEYLGMENMNVDIYGRSSQKYKTNVYLTYTGLDRFAEGWAFMSAEDGYGIEIISPEAMLDDLTIAHEFGHVVTMQQKAWVDQGITGAWWEPLANWFREMYLGSDYYTGTTQTCGFEPYLRNMSLTVPHGRNYYEVWPFYTYLSYNPDNIDGLGITAVKRLISEAKPNEHPFETITRLFGEDAQTVFGNYAKRMATFDFGAKAAYQQEFSNLLRSYPFYWNLFYTVPQPVYDKNGSAQVYRVPQEEAPMQSGINIVPLRATGSSITVDFTGLSDDTNAAWKACIVTVDTAGRESYSDLFGDGESMTVSANGAASAYLTVTAMPKTLYRPDAFHKEKESPYKSGEERRRYPYEIKLDGAEIIPSAASAGAYNTNVRGRRHANGGGFVANTAKVDDSVYVAPNAFVLDSATLTGNVRVEDYAIVAGTTAASDNVVIGGHAIVSGGGWVYDNGWKYGNVTLSGNAVIGGGAVVTNSCTVSGNAKVLQKAYLSEGITVGDNAVAKGMAYPMGTSSFTGSAIIDGDYSNTETKNSGVGFGWLDENGWYRAEDGYIAAYDFANRSSVWAADKYAATNAMQSGAEWSGERTSAKGVLNFSGGGDCLIIDDSVLQARDIQISLAALWKGGKSGQELFRFGDGEAYLALSPENENGVAELTLTDGKTTEKLTAPAALAKGEWSKITVRIIGGEASLIINGQPADSRSVSLSVLDIMNASQRDRAVIGESFKGALDYVNFSYKAVDEPNVAYTGSEEPDNSEPDTDILWGDANLDEKVTVADAVAILQSIANKDKYALKPQGAKNADCFDPGDGVTGKDALAIQRLDAKEISALPDYSAK